MEDSNVLPITTAGSHYEITDSSSRTNVGTYGICGSAGGASSQATTYTWPTTAYTPTYIWGPSWDLKIRRVSNGYVVEHKGIELVFTTEAKLADYISKLAVKK